MVQRHTKIDGVRQMLFKECGILDHNIIIIINAAVSHSGETQPYASVCDYTELKVMQYAGSKLTPMHYYAEGGVIPLLYFWRHPIISSRNGVDEAE